MKARQLIPLEPKPRMSSLAIASWAADFGRRKDVHPEARDAMMFLALHLQHGALPTRDDVEMFTSWETFT